MTTAQKPENPPFHPHEMGLHEGATLFDYFLGQAMVGLLSCSQIHNIQPDHLDAALKMTAGASAKLADFAIKEREKWLSQYR